MKFGFRVFYGDATRLDLLHAAGADSAQLLVVALDNADASTQLVRTARKHLGWYARDLAGANEARAAFNSAESTAAQTAAVVRFFDRLAARGDRRGDMVQAARYSAVCAR